MTWVYFTMISWSVTRGRHYWRRVLSRAFCEIIYNKTRSSPINPFKPTGQDETRRRVAARGGTKCRLTERITGWQFLFTAVSTTRRRVTSPPSSNRRATLVTGSVYARRRRPSSMFLAPNTWPSVAVRSVQLQLMCGTVCQWQCSLLSHWTFFDAAWKLNCSSVLTTDTATAKRLYCCVSHFHFPAAFCCGCNLEVYRL